MHQLVVRSAEFGMTGEFPESCGINHRLGMFDSKAKRKWFGLEEYTAPIQHAQSVARAVPESEHHMLAAQDLAAGEHHAFDLAVFDQHVGDFAFEAHVAAERDDFVTHFSTTPVSRKVPMCGLLTKRISSGAPARTNSCITLRP